MPEALLLAFQLAVSWVWVLDPKERLVGMLAKVYFAWASDKVDQLESPEPLVEAALNQ